MNPLVLFDYVYYSIAYVYANKFDYEEQKEIAGISILSMLQFFNIVTIFRLLFKPLRRFEIFDPILMIILSYSLFMALNFIRYKKFVNYSQLADKWDNEKETTRLIKIVCVVCYMVLSIFSSI